MEKPYLEQIFKYVRTSKVSDLVQATSVGLVQNTNLALSSDRVYLSGYGMGSTFAAYVAFCFPGSVSGLVQAGGHGYKRKGDGVMLNDGAGECAECQYYPVKVLPALSLGRALKHCAFATMNDAISPPPLHRAMCAALNANGHTSTLYMDPDPVGHGRPTRFLARAALCLQIGGATAPIPPSPDPCTTSSSSVALSSSVASVASVASAHYGNHLSVASPTLHPPLAITAEACPASDWAPTLTR